MAKPKFNRFERATQIWPVLVLAAHNRQILNYKLLGKCVGIPAQGLAGILDPIQNYCADNDLPPLTVLVVKDDAGSPGHGFIASQNYPQAQADVFKKKWPSTPTAQEFHDAPALQP